MDARDTATVDKGGRRVSRRAALAPVGGGAAAALLAACGDTAPAPPAAPAATGATGAGAATRPPNMAAMAEHTYTFPAHSITLLTFAL